MRQETRIVTRITLLLSTIALVNGCTDAPTSPPTPPPSPTAPLLSGSSASGIPTGKTVVVFNDTTSIPLAGLTLVRSLGGVITAQWDDIGVAFVTGLTASALSVLQGNSLVAAVGNDRIIDWLPRLTIGGVTDAGPGALAHRNPAQASFYADGRQWGPRIIEADKAWAVGLQGTPSTRVAILDTGIDYGNREMVGLVDLAASTSFSELIVAEAGIGATVPVEPQVPGDEPYMDNHFHGTHVASTVASNSIGVAGVAPHVTLIAVKVLNFLGSGSFESVASGIRHAAGPANADVINMSLGAVVEPAEEGVPALLELMSRTIRSAEKQGTIVISAAGNDALDLDAGTVVSTPCEQSTICVSATGPLLQQNFDQPATYTNFGATAIEVAAPGGNFVDGDDTAYQTEDLIIGACSRRTTQPALAPCRASTDGVAYFYAWAAGTSMASPHAAGVAALVKSYAPTLSVTGLRARVLHSADDVQAKGRDVYTNWGRINVARALGVE